MPMIADLGLDPGRTQLIYEWDAREYLQSLPLEHFRESTAQSTQRKITVESFDVIRKLRPDIQCFSELLIQYVREGENPDKPGRVVPDNMVFVHPKPIEAEGSYMLPIHRVVPTLILEYVSKSNERKDYQDNYKKYERELQVPFYLVFHPENEDLRVFRLAGGEYLRLPPNSEERFSIPDLELQAGLLDGWVRFWFRGELVPLPGDLMDEVDE
jgi:Uma2 family endonuclease